MIAVHCGAGQYNENNTKKFKRLMRLACSKGLDIIKNNAGTAIEAVTEAIKVLEDDPLTNAGYGSNLTINGTVECDAAIMNGENAIFGACGAVENVKNPISLAYEIYKNQLNELPLGLQPPSVLVGNGAYKQAKASGLTLINGKKLIGRKAFKTHRKYKQRLETVLEYCKQKNEEEESTKTTEVKIELVNENMLLGERLDTVGAVCIDTNGNVAAGSSSGGILLKRSGRVGQTIHYGSGVWADLSTNQNTTSKFGLACCTTGCGEQIMQTFLAKTIADDLIQSKNNCPTIDLYECLLEKFINSKYLKNTKITKLCGALVLKVDYSTGIVSLLWGHSSNSMAVGYMQLTSQNTYRNNGQISNLPNGAVEGQSINVGGTEFYLKKNN